MKHILLAGAVLALAGCAASSSATSGAQSVFAAESAYDVAAHAEVAMLASGTLTAAEQASMRHYDEQVYATLIPLRAAAESGTGVIPQAELDAAQAALSALSAFVAAHQGK